MTPKDKPATRRRKPLTAEARATNQQRCKAFRARRKQHEAELQAAVYSLRAQLAELMTRHSLQQELALYHRQALSGSLVQLAREMKYMIQCGVGGHLPLDTVQSKSGMFADQRAFVNHVMVPQAQGNCADILMVMRMFESCYERYFCEVRGAVVSGTEDDPMVTLRSLVHVRFGMPTFQTMFPHILRPEHAELKEKLMHRTVVYECTSFFRFTPDGRIWLYDAHMDVAGGLLRALGSVEETLAVLTPDARRGIAQKKVVPMLEGGMSKAELRAAATVAAEVDVTMVEESPEAQGPGATQDTRNPLDKHTVEFLLS